MYYVIRIFTIVILLLPGIIEAQSVPNISLAVSNETPQPGGVVSMSLQGVPAEQQATLRWFSNGALLSQWNGDTAPQIPIADLTRQRIEAQVGGRVVARAFINPIYIDIVVEPGTYVPPHYSGRPLPSTGSIVRLVALVETAHNFNPQNYTFTWRLGGRTVGGGALVGNNDIFITMPGSSPREVEVTIQNTSGRVIGTHTTSLPSVTSQVLFYPIHSLYGLRSRGYSDAMTFSPAIGTTLLAAPYYVPTQLFNPNANRVTTWRLNNQEIASNTGQELTITLQRSQLQDTSYLEFTTFNRTDVRQQASGRIRLDI